MLKRAGATTDRIFLSQRDDVDSRMKLGLSISSLENTRMHWESFGEVMKGIKTPERRARQLPPEAFTCIKASPDSRRYDSIIRSKNEEGESGRMYHSARKLAFSRM